MCTGPALLFGRYVPRCVRYLGTCMYVFAFERQGWQAILKKKETPASGSLRVVAKKELEWNLWGAALRYS